MMCSASMPEPCSSSLHPPQSVTIPFPEALVSMDFFTFLRSISVISLNWAGCMQHVLFGSSLPFRPIAFRATDMAYSTNGTLHLTTHPGMTMMSSPVHSGSGHPSRGLMGMAYPVSL